MYRDIEQQRAQIHQLTQALAEKKADTATAQQLQEMLDGIFQSKSWRVTKPLRDITRLLRKDDRKGSYN
jgi:hypothetical protein